MELSEERSAHRRPQRGLLRRAWGAFFGYSVAWTFITSLKKENWASGFAVKSLTDDCDGVLLTSKGALAYLLGEKSIEIFVSPFCVHAAL